jgi:hypothetical protein
VPEPMSPKDAALAAARMVHDAAKLAVREKFAAAYSEALRERKEADNAYFATLAEIGTEYPLITEGADGAR